MPETGDDEASGSDSDSESSDLEELEQVKPLQKRKRPNKTSVSTPTKKPRNK